MSEILKDMATPVLIKAVKDNLYGFFRSLTQSPKVDFVESDGLVRWHSSMHHPWFNAVLCTQPASTHETSIIQDTLAYFRSRKVPIITWWMETNLPVDAWKQSLLAQGFKVDKNTPGMAMDLSTLEPKQQLPNDLQIEQVTDLETLHNWADTFVHGFELPDGWKAGIYETFATLGLDLPIRYYLGYLAGEKVAISMLFLGAGVAGIYCVATVPEARKQGIGAALTLKPLYDAYELGYRVGVLQSSEAGFGLYQKLGFQKVCDMDHYFWADQGHPS